MNYEKLKSAVHDLRLESHSDIGIVFVYFTWHGAKFKAQFDADNTGLYAFELVTPERLFVEADCETGYYDEESETIEEEAAA